MHYYIGIDDTDNLESRGTGFRARELGALLESEGIAKLRCITRHQLLVHTDIPFTSHNSSASILVECDPEKEKELIICCREYLLRESATGSDAGLCVAAENNIGHLVENWGKQAKMSVLKKEDAHSLADSSSIYLEGLTGEKIGVVGSLAAVSLRYTGNDGRVLWLPYLRETEGIYIASALKQRITADCITTREGEEIPCEEKILVNGWLRPVMRNKKITLLVDKIENNDEYEWEHVPKDYIKSISNG